MLNESALPVVMKMTYIATLTAAPRGFIISQLITLFRSLSIAMRRVTTPQDVTKLLLPITNRILIHMSLLWCSRYYTDGTCIQVSLKIVKAKMLAVKRDFGGYRKLTKRRVFEAYLREMAEDIKDMIDSFLIAWTRHPNECSLSTICLEETTIHSRVWELMKDCTVSEPRKRRSSFISERITNALLRKRGYEALAG
ncbi:uncharacterized protein BT62DRAFT_303877 [Guyanagaster necrorhizus]|uniref:Uncharacterized protein n=1 Tax=Guyanagaster necrorhizus TaxID=856835 RepID=A0A9P7VQ02_9AGAR|nr:uncharacterized protein BT62DRAFT_303877 [Guyanagaster necrorhizus MCA 3950]KAG7443894.1 hypothetical protein BT62DRAFT_303877 [Guyanagaster necrorhizus MCA 3950]